MACSLTGWGGGRANEGNASLERIPAAPRKGKISGTDNSELLFL